DGSSIAQANAGSYAVVASLNNAIYIASVATGALTIDKATATITLSNLTQGYDGSPKPVTATTSPAGLTVVSITYDGSSTAPNESAEERGVGTLDNAKYSASNATGTLNIRGSTTMTLRNLTR